ncbi:hypothetical protein D3C78_1012490 [compost metagenome]
MRHRQKIIRRYCVPLIVAHTQQNLIITITSQAHYRLRHQDKAVVIQRTLYPMQERHLAFDFILHQITAALHILRLTAGQRHFRQRAKLPQQLVEVFKIGQHAAIP